MSDSCDPMDCSLPGKNGLLFSSPGALPNPGIDPRSSALQEDSLPSEPPGKSIQMILGFK